ncbi:MAG: glucoamylase family protein, partial [Clostridia bacterium]
MKKNKILCVLLTLLILTTILCGCFFDPDVIVDESTLLTKYSAEIDKEMKGSFNFFWDCCSLSENGGYGIISDRWPTQSGIGSVASIGFGLTAYVIGVEQGYVSLVEAKERTSKTLDNLLILQQESRSAYKGFFYHFLSMKTGEKYGDCEISTIDTAILLCGALTAGEYFGGEIKEKATQLYSFANWKAYEKTRGGKKYISMGYKNGKILDGCWDWYAEQLMIYVLGAGSPTNEYRLSDETYYDFARKTGSYNDKSYIFSYFGSIFTYQFSHAWIDFSEYKDREGVNWFENSVNASKVAYEYCVDNQKLSKTYSDKSWGLTACDVRGGYSGYLGTPPRGWTPDDSYRQVQGTIAPAGAIGSVVFTPKESLVALKNYQSIPEINTRYGIMDSYNLDQEWYASDCIGIDKGISLLMLANFKNKCVWEVF